MNSWTDDHIEQCATTLLATWDMCGNEFAAFCEYASEYGLPRSNTAWVRVAFLSQRMRFESLAGLSDQTGLPQPAPEQRTEDTL